MFPIHYNRFLADFRNGAIVIVDRLNFSHIGPFGLIKDAVAEAARRNEREASRGSR